MNIRLARAEEIHLLPALEADAGTLFAEHGMPDIDDDDATPASAYESLLPSQTVWVSTDREDVPVGFLAAGFEGDGMFVYELSVSRLYQGNGLGRALLAEARAAAEAGEARWLGLTTFLTVPWNAPYYERQGFKVVADADLPEVLKPVIARERLRWPDPARERCAMLIELRP